MYAPKTFKPTNGQQGRGMVIKAGHTMLKRWGKGAIVVGTPQQQADLRYISQVKEEETIL